MINMPNCKTEQFEQNITYNLVNNNDNNINKDLVSDMISSRNVKSS